MKVQKHTRNGLNAITLVPSSCGLASEAIELSTKSTSVLTLEFFSNGDSENGEGARCFVSCATFAKKEKCGEMDRVSVFQMI